jgi:hypothetical protein
MVCDLEEPQLLPALCGLYCEACKTLGKPHGHAMNEPT